jgi:hypothetical protein
MRDALPELDLAARIGVNVGEVVTGTTERLAAGDAMNVAARLEHAALPGTILIGKDTYKLVHGAVGAEPVEAVALFALPRARHALSVGQSSLAPPTLARSVLSSWTIAGLFYSLGPELGGQLFGTDNAIVSGPASSSSPPQSPSCRS